LVIFVRPAKTAEPIKMPFWMVTRWAQGTMYWMGVQIPQGKGQFLVEKWRLVVSRDRRCRTSVWCINCIRQSQSVP